MNELGYTNKRVIVSGCFSGMGEATARLLVELGAEVHGLEAVIVWTMLNSSPLIKKGIRINCILPGPTQTPMTAQLESMSGKAVMEAAMQPINRFATPLEQAGPLVFLNSDLASYVNGVVLPVDGGFMGGVTTGQIDLRAMMKNAS